MFYPEWMRPGTANSKESPEKIEIKIEQVEESSSDDNSAPEPCGSLTDQEVMDSDSGSESDQPQSWRDEIKQCLPPNSAYLDTSVAIGRATVFERLVWTPHCRKINIEETTEEPEEIQEFDLQDSYSDYYTDSDIDSESRSKDLVFLYKSRLRAEFESITDDDSEYSYSSD